MVLDDKVISNDVFRNQDPCYKSTQSILSESSSYDRTFIVMTITATPITMMLSTCFQFLTFDLTKSFFTAFTRELTSATTASLLNHDFTWRTRRRMTRKSAGMTTRKNSITGLMT